MTTVSVILPFLDAERFLADAIASVRAQSLTEWELLLVDDGSTDRSPAIAAEAAAADSRIRLLSASSGSASGPAAARNLGLRAARGEFVAFLDADDLFEPHQLRAQVQAFREHPEVAMVYGPTRWWHPQDEQRDWVEKMRGVKGRVHRPPTLLNRVVLMQRGDVPCTCSVMITRGAVEQVGGFEESFRLYEDQTLWVKLLLRYPVYVTDVVGARYRQHDGSASARSQRLGVYDRMQPHRARTAFLAWVRDHARASGLADPDVERALRFAFAPYADLRTALTVRDRLTLAWVAAGRKARSWLRWLLVIRRRHFGQLRR